MNVCFYLFEDKYIPIFETVAIEFCKDHIEVDKASFGEGNRYGPIEVGVSLQNFLNGGSEDWRKFPYEKHKKSKKNNFINLLKYDKRK